MKVSVLAVTAAAFAMLGALPASAETEPTGVYANLGYSFVDAGSGFKFGALTGRIGGRFYQYFGVEGEGAIGVDGDDTTLSGVNVKTKLKHSLNGYVVGFVPLGENFELLARGGYGTTKIKASALGASASGSDESWNYGVGAQYLIDGKNGLRADYTRFDFGSGNEDANVWSVGYVRKF
jgi:outer membrane immunogenic protein